MCESKAMFVSYSVYEILEAFQHFENVNRNIFLKSCVSNKIPITTKSIIYLEKNITKLF